MELTRLSFAASHLVRNLTPRGLCERGVEQKAGSVVEGRTFTQRRRGTLEKAESQGR